MKRIAARYLMFVVAAAPLGAVAYDVDTDKYFAYTQEWGGVYLLLSKQPCTIAPQEVAKFAPKALETCSSLGGSACTLAPQKSWQHGQRFWPRERVLRDFCWRELTGKTGDNASATTIAICQAWSGSQLSISCTLPLKQAFISTESLPQSPHPPKKAAF